MTAVVAKPSALTQFVNFLFGYPDEHTLDESDPREKQVAKLTAMYAKNRTTFLRAARSTYNAQNTKLAKRAGLHYAPVKDLSIIMEDLEQGDPDNVWVEVWKAGERERRADLLEEINAAYPGKRVYPIELLYCETLADYEQYRAMVKQIRALYRTAATSPYVVELAIDTAARNGIPAGKLS